jgi:uncharacterized protein
MALTWRADARYQGPFVGRVYDGSMPATSFSEADLDRLESWLLEPQRGEEALMPDGLQGLLCAVVSAPSPIPSSKWIPAGLGEDPKYASHDERDSIERLLVAFHDDVAAQLNGGEHFDMVLYGEDGTEDQDASLASWCEGYLMGVELADPPWSEQASEEELDDMLMPFVILSGRAREAAVESGEAWVDAADERRMMREAREALTDVVLDNRAYWFERSIPGTVRREAPKVGRNDPSPCGSGKKYKHCHGRDD